LLPGYFALSLVLESKRMGGGGKLRIKNGEWKIEEKLRSGLFVVFVLVSVMAPSFRQGRLAERRIATL
jgi:hypothetical protein